MPAPHIKRRRKNAAVAKKTETPVKQESWSVVEKMKKAVETVVEESVSEQKEPEKRDEIVPEVLKEETTPKRKTKRLPKAKKTD